MRRRVTFRDDTLPHQIRLVFTTTSPHGIKVTCACGAPPVPVTEAGDAAHWGVFNGLAHDTARGPFVAVGPAAWAPLVTEGAA